VARDDAVDERSVDAGARTAGGEIPFELGAIASLACAVAVTRGAQEQNDTPIRRLNAAPCG
jgi:hypothetical protein